MNLGNSDSQGTEMVPCASQRLLPIVGDPGNVEFSPFPSKGVFWLPGVDGLHSQPNPYFCQKIHKDTTYFGILGAEGTRP